MRVCITAQQRQLEEKHATGPDGGGPAKPRQNQFRDEWLNLKEQESA
jgi:hypothetical protein